MQPCFSRGVMALLVMHRLQMQLGACTHGLGEGKSMTHPVSPQTCYRPESYSCSCVWLSMGHH